MSESDRRWDTNTDRRWDTVSDRWDTVAGCVETSGAPSTVFAGRAALASLRAEHAEMAALLLRWYYRYAEDIHDDSQDTAVLLARIQGEAE